MPLGRSVSSYHREHERDRRLFLRNKQETFHRCVSTQSSLAPRRSIGTEAPFWNNDVRDLGANEGLASGSSSAVEGLIRKSRASLWQLGVALTLDVPRLC